MRIWIIGGTGAMGSLFAGVFARAGWEVEATGRNMIRTPEELAEWADVVMVSVPVRATVSVIEGIAPFLREDHLLCDLTSLKSVPAAAMEKTAARLIGLHPMFGPGVASLRGQTIIATPLRCPGEACAALLSVFEAEGAEVSCTTPEEHDRIMSVVQGLMHYSTLVVADTMRREGVDPAEMLKYMSPVYRIETDLVGRILGQDADLYGAILQENPSVKGVLASFAESAEELKGIVDGGDEEAFTAFFAANADHFSAVIPAATEETNLLIESLVRP